MATGELGVGLSGGRYEAPELVVIGSVSELTLDVNKTYGHSDGFMFNNVPITNASA